MPDPIETRPYTMVASGGERILRENIWEKKTGTIHYKRISCHQTYTMVASGGNRTLKEILEKILASPDPEDISEK